MTGILLLIMFWVAFWHNMDVEAFPEEGYDDKRRNGLFILTLICTIVGAISLPILMGVFLG